MHRKFRPVIALLVAVAFMVSGWAAMAVATADCLGCQDGMQNMGSMQSKGDMGGKEKPAEDCMLKITCAATTAQLPLPLPLGAAVTHSLASYPATAAPAYRSHQISPPLSPPRLSA